MVRSWNLVGFLDFLPQGCDVFSDTLSVRISRSLPTYRNIWMTTAPRFRPSISPGSTSLMATVEIGRRGLSQLGEVGSLSPFFTGFLAPSQVVNAGLLNHQQYFILSFGEKCPKICWTARQLWKTWKMTGVMTPTNRRSWNIPRKNGPLYSYPWRYVDQKKAHLQKNTVYVWVYLHSELWMHFQRLYFSGSSHHQTTSANCITHTIHATGIFTYMNGWLLW